MFFVIRFQINEGSTNGVAFIRCTLLLTKVECLDNRTVTLDINLLQVHKQLTTLTYKTQQRTLCAVVVTVALHVLGKVVDTVGE